MTTKKRSVTFDGDSLDGRIYRGVGYPSAQYRELVTRVALMCNEVARDHAADGTIGVLVNDTIDVLANEALGLDLRVAVLAGVAAAIIADVDNPGGERS